MSLRRTYLSIAAVMFCLAAAGGVALALLKLNGTVLFILLVVTAFFVYAAAAFLTSAIINRSILRRHRRPSAIAADILVDVLFHR